MKNDWSKRRAEFLADYARPMPVEEMAAKYNLTVDSVYVQARKFGAPTRPRIDGRAPAVPAHRIRSEAKPAKATKPRPAAPPKPADAPAPDRARLQALFGSPAAAVVPAPKPAPRPVPVPGPAPVLTPEPTAPKPAALPAPSRGMRRRKPEPEVAFYTSDGLHLVRLSRVPGWLLLHPHAVRAGVSPTTLNETTA